MAIEQVNDRKERPEKEIADDIVRLKEWLSKQPHLPQDLGNQLLQCFVINTNSLEIAKSKLDSWFTDRGKYPMFFSYEMRDPMGQAYNDIIKCLKIWILPKTTPDGSRVIMLDGGTDLTKYNTDSFVMYSTMIIEYMISRWPKTKSVCAVYNLKAINASIISKINPSSLITFLQWYQRSVPLKLKSVYLINSIPFAETIAQMIKPFVKEKLYNRLTVTRRDESCLREYFPNEILPSDYGGEELSSEDLSADLHKNIVERAEWYKKTSHQVANESLRPPDENNTYGVQGTFRSLGLD